MSAGGLLVLAGPTAVGKTGLTLELCGRFGAEVISADSVAVYRGLDIGSAKPSPQETALAPHHLIDVADPEEKFDAARFAELADRAVEDIQSRGKKVIVAGGTGLYLRALLFGLMPSPPADPRMRVELSLEWEKKGPKAMHRILAGMDPKAAGKLHPNDRQRVLRAIEVCRLAAKPLSELQAEHGFSSARYEHLLVGLFRPRDELNTRIEQRCRKMWGQGLLDEVRGLTGRGLGGQTRSLGTLGYRHALAYLGGKMTEDEALGTMIKDTRAYAKRQMTWFRGMKGLTWHQAGDLPGLVQLANDLWNS